MSQFFIGEIAGGPSGELKSLTGNNPVPVFGDNAGNINVVGIGGVTVAGNPGTSTLTISISGSGFTWTDQSGAFAALAENGYFITGTSTGTLPAAPSQGDTISFIVDSSTQFLTIQATAGKIIRLGNTASAAAGKAVSTAQGDAITLVYRTSDTTWITLNSVGNWTIT